MTGINRVRYSQDGKEKRKAGLFIGLYAFVIILMIAFVCFYAVMFAENGMNDVIPALSFALASAITLIFSLIRGPHMLFAMKDYDMLMSLSLIHILKTVEVKASGGSNPSLCAIKKVRIAM